MPANGTSQPSTATRCEARRSASSAMAISARSFRNSPKRSAWSDLLRSHRQAPPRQHRADGSLPDFWPRATSSRLHVPETPATHGMIGAAEIRAMKSGRLSDQQQPRHGRRLDALATRSRERRLAARRSMFSRSSRVPTWKIPFAAPGPGQRHSDAACRRLDRGGAGAHRRRGRAQADRVQRRRLDHGRRQFPPGATADPAARHPFHPGPAQPARHALESSNDLFARHAVNIAAQYYETNSDIGYVVLDADASAADSQRVLSEIRALEGTIRARLVYEHRG